MSYKISTNTYDCDICGFEESWDHSNDIHGSIWGCEKCESIFCTKCFIDRHGLSAYEKMLRESDRILCPSCWEGAVKND